MWNDMPADIKVWKSMFVTFNKMYKSFTFATLSIWLMLLFLLVCNDYILSVMWLTCRLSYM